MLTGREWRDGESTKRTACSSLYVQPDRYEKRNETKQSKEEKGDDRETTISRDGSEQGSMYRGCRRRITGRGNVAGLGYHLRMKWCGKMHAQGSRVIVEGQSGCAHDNLQNDDRRVAGGRVGQKGRCERRPEEGREWTRETRQLVSSESNAVQRSQKIEIHLKFRKLKSCSEKSKQFGKKMFGSDNSKL